MIERQPGEYTPYETRAEANDTVDRQVRYRQITDCLREKPNQTAKEIAVMMFRKGLIPTSERNFTAPRLTELSRTGRVEIMGKTKCRYTGKTVTVYAIREAAANG